MFELPRQVVTQIFLAYYERKVGQCPQRLRRVFGILLKGFANRS